MTLTPRYSLKHRTISAALPRLFYHAYFDDKISGAIADADMISRCGPTMNNKSHAAMINDADSAFPPRPARPMSDHEYY